MLRDDFIYILPAILIAFWQSQVYWKNIPSIYPNEIVSKGHYTNMDVSFMNLVKQCFYVVFIFQAFMPIAIIPLSDVMMTMFRAIGYVLVVTGLYVSVSAVKTMKNNWKGMFHYSIVKNHTLVTHGVFSKIRHPIYLAVFIESIGYQLIVRSWLVIPITVIIFFILRYHIPYEEALLRKQFGSSYKEYSRRTWALIPFVY